jgi:hypothetical protein
VRVKRAPLIRISARHGHAASSRPAFQVCLPTPMAVTYAYRRENDVIAVFEAYEREMMREVTAICAAIPHGDLCIQWDVCHEMLIWDGQPLDMFPKVGSSKEDIVGRWKVREGASMLASKYVPSFGIATECGIARARVPDLVKSIIRSTPRLQRNRPLPNRRGTRSIQTVSLSASADIETALTNVRLTP